jgi:four helix bundle protein
MKTHHDLHVWQKSVEYVTDIYKTTSVFPTDEKFGLTNQIRRCGVSIPSNIAEGAARNSSKEFIRFLRISMGSAAELQTQLTIARNLKYIETHQFDTLMLRSIEISKMLSGLIHSINKKQSAS